MNYDLVWTSLLYCNLETIYLCLRTTKIIRLNNYFWKLLCERNYGDVYNKFDGNFYEKYKSCIKLLKFYITVNHKSQLKDIFDEYICLGESIQLIHVPTEIGKLNNLEMLWFPNNRLKNVPSEIGNLKLFSLNLRNNDLEFIPSELGNCKNLRYLRLQNNKIKNIPTEFGNLNKLTELDLENNIIKRVPSELGQLTRLSWLNLMNNKIEYLPKEVMNLKIIK